MSDNKNDNSGCFFTIALVCGVILVLYILGQAAQGIGKAYKDSPENVMMWVFIIGAVCYVIYRLRKM